MPAYFQDPGCIFKEDFASERIVAVNGGMFRGVGISSSGIYSTNTAKVIMYDNKFAQLRNKNLTNLTICAHADLTPFTGTAKTLLRMNSVYVAPYIEIQHWSTTNQICVYNGVANNLLPIQFTPALNSSIIITKTGTTWTGYVNTISCGSLSIVMYNYDAADMFRNHSVGNTLWMSTRSWNNKLYQIAIYDYAFTQTDVYNYHQQCMNRF